MITRMAMITGMMRTRMKISTVVQMAVKSLEEAAKVIIPNNHPPLSLFPQQL
jgi:hypothetical protein